MKWLLLTALLLSPGAYASSVFVCTNPVADAYFDCAWSAQWMVKADAAVQSTDKLLVCPSGTPGPQTINLCPNMHWVAKSSTQPTDLIGTCGNLPPGQQPELCLGNGEGFSIQGSLFVAAPIAHPASPDKCVAISPIAVNFKMTINPPGLLAAAADPNSYGLITWWCMMPYRAEAVIHFDYRKDLPPAFLSILNMLPSASLDQVNALIAQYGYEADPSHPLYALAVNQAAMTKPADPVWVVAKNGSSLTRPMYSEQMKIRNSTKALTDKATVGDECACYWLPIPEPTANGTINSYCPVKATPQLPLTLNDTGKVTLCTKKP